MLYRTNTFQTHWPSMLLGSTLLLAACCCTESTGAVAVRDGGRPTVGVVIGPQANALDRYAAEELCGYLRKLYGVQTRPTHAAPQEADVVFLIGDPKTNPVAAKALAPGGWPRVSDQGIVLKRTRVGDKPALVVGGGSPQATLWAVYELVQRWGLRYLLHGDVLPADPGTLNLPTENLILEPALRVRQWRVLNVFACGPESWGMADYRPLLDQLAKLKFNRVLLNIWTYQPFLPLEVKGIKRKTATLWFDYHYPITNDMPGRRLFGQQKEFWNPDLPPANNYEEFAVAGRRLVRGIMEHARARGMQCVITAVPTEFPPEFAPLLKDYQKMQQLGAMSIVPSAATDASDPAVVELASAVLRTTVDTYPRADYVALAMPEFRQWASQYEKAWQTLDRKYGIGKTCTLADVLAAAAARPVFEPSDVGRAVQEVKGDIVALCFYDRLLTELCVLKESRRPDMKFIYYGVSEELFPVLPQVVPAGSETLNQVDYNASRIVKRRDVLARMDVRRVPASLIYTLHDDNIGLLPQLATGSLHELSLDLRRHGWAGFSTRYWLVGDHDPCVAYLAKAAWDDKATPEAVYRDQIRAVCGAPCVEDLLAAFREVEKATVDMEVLGLYLTFPVPEMIKGQFVAEKIPEVYGKIRECYRRARTAAMRAAAKSRPAGRAYAEYWVGRLEFGIGYFDCIEAVRQATALRAESDQALKSGKSEDAKQKKAAAQAEMNRALDLSRAMLEAYARVARDQSDRGAIATMAEYVYRPLNAKTQQWSK